jgi:hypothetical protein
MVLEKQVNPKGGGQEMQLPDIITKQQGLVDKIKKRT